MEPLEVAQLIKKKQASGSVPLGIVFYNVEHGKVEFSLFEHTDVEEVNALLAKAGLSTRIIAK